MTDGRRFALELLGPYGPRTRERIAEMVKAEHEACVDAQEASGHRSRGVYGEFWRGILEQFEEFGILPGATLVCPGSAPYKIPVMNGVALFPWRYARSRETRLAETPFVTSDARAAATALRLPIVDDGLDLGFPDAGLTTEEAELVNSFVGATKDPAVTTGKLVLVAISSSLNGLFAVEWGEAQVTSAGFVEWSGFHESLLQLPVKRPVSTSPTGTFTTGPLPSKFPQAEGEVADDEGNE